MALLQTPALNAELALLDFNLRGVDGKTYTLDDIKGENGTAILFICNHCPYVKGVIERMVDDCKALQADGIGIAAIMPNDTENYPADSFENMKAFAAEHGFTFPYLIDESQDTARAYGAVCTPDLFGFNASGSLQYRGRLDSAGPKAPEGEIRREFLEAMRMIAHTGEGPSEQFPSMGCSIKWKN